MIATTFLHALLLLLCPFRILGLFTDCGFDRVLKAGDVVSIQSPNYPSDPYPHNAECIWHFQSLASGVEVSTEFFNVEHYQPNICPDRFTLEAPKGTRLIDPCFAIPKRATFGAEPPFNFTVTFRSDDRIHWMGFNVSFTAYDGRPFVKSNCGHRYRLKKPTTKFSLVSPNWPFTPAKNSLCSWTIENPLDKQSYRVKLEFVHMDYSTIEKLKIVDSGKPVKIGTDCWSEPQRVRYFRSRRLSVDYEAKGDSLDERIMVNVSVVKNSQCREDAVRCPTSGRCMPIYAFCSGPEVCDIGNDRMLSICKTLEACGKQSVKPNIDFAKLGTNKAKPGSWPWLGVLHREAYGKMVPVGSATVIAPRWLITSADVACYWREANHSVAVGVNNLKEPEFEWTTFVNVKRIIVHPKYQYQGTAYNLALIMLEEEIEMPFNERVNTICLPDSDNPFGMDRWKNCTLTGWRWTDPLLAQLQASIFDQWECGQIPEYEGKINLNVMCAKYWDHDFSFSLRGGGPLACLTDEQMPKWTIYGVDPPARYPLPGGIFQQTRVRSQVQFIWQTMLDHEAAERQQHS